MIYWKKFLLSAFLLAFPAKEFSQQANVNGVQVNAPDKPYLGLRIFGSAPGQCMVIDSNNVVVTAPFCMGSASLSGSTNLTGLGDSLTAGAYSSGNATTSWPAQLSAILHYVVNNLGASSQTSTQAAVRVGAEPSTVTVSGGYIPTSGSVNVSFSPVDPVFSANAFTFAAVIGGVPGTLSYNTGTAMDVFTPSAYPASPVAVSAGSSWTPVFGTMFNGFTTIWLGRNNISNAATIVHDVQMIVAMLPTPKRYLVLSVINGDQPLEYSGAANYNQILADNAALQAAFPSNYLDIRSALVASWNPSNAQDVIDHGHDVPPSSIRGQSSTTLAAAVTDPTATSITLAACPVFDTIVFAGGEKAYISSCSGNVATVIRGYASTTASTYSNGATVSLINYEHLYDNGYAIVAAQVNSWFRANQTYLLPVSSFYDLLAGYVATGQTGALTLSGLTQNTTYPTDMNLQTGWPWTGYTAASSTLNVPVSSSSYVCSVDGVGFSSGNYVQQLCWDSSSNLWRRGEWAGTWTAWKSISVPTTGVSGNIGGSALAAGAFAQGNIALTGATTSNSACYAVPVSACTPDNGGVGFSVKCEITASNTATVKVIAPVAATPTSCQYRAFMP